MKKLVRPIYSARNILSFDLLYHGSDAEVKVPELGKNTIARKDFGYGFYCTNIKEQAERWAKKKGSGNGVVSIYTWNPGAMNSLKCLEFKSIAEEKDLNLWLNEIIRNRHKDSISHDFDIIAGPMADDYVWYSVQDYIEAKNRGLDLEPYFEKVKQDALGFDYHTQQIVFCTQRAIDVLKFESSYEI